MGRSQETQNKKEKEKKKLKKRKEKEEKREERKANSSKGKSFEEMLAYVDENGNISATPPDPNKRKVINQEDIKIGSSRQVVVEDTDIIRTGVVTFFNDSKGYGFIKDQKTQAGVFVHVNGLLEPIKENDKVTFEVEMGLKGTNAVKVSLIKKVADTEPKVTEQNSDPA